MRLQWNVGILLVACMCATMLDAARPKLRRKRERVHKETWSGKPFTENPVYAQLNESQASEFGRLLRDYDVLDDVTDPVTIFAPQNTQLETLDIREMPKDAVKEVLKGHIVAGYIMPKSIYEDAELRNLRGQELNWEQDDDTLMVEGARIRDWHVTPHAIIYIVDDMVVDEDD